ncbi:TerC family protein [Polaribacter sp. Hel1_85]|uniref:TerC family protein n=1 Tax=Polaribacter sp. Hel1_85 TaxID=1250005 RepID=UPI00052C774F|nr:TerC family protein [Polaribacter sp. Hel1_85]KGL63721.1 integral membrane protein TerC [Polaribacter sp. Hel1_85]
MEIFAHADTWVALLTLTFLEIILGIDNIIFISISANKLPENQVRKATLLGLALAMITRILLLFSVSYLISLKEPFLVISNSWFKTALTGQSIILFLGGLFLLYKSTKEIREKVEHTNEDEVIKSPKIISFTNVIFQIILIDIVFSFDSILTAVGMTNGINGALIIMVIAVVISIIIMMIFSKPISSFVNNNPTIQMLALSFLILIGFMLITEGAHLSHTEIFNKTVGAIPKGYLYFAIAFSLGVEMLNLRIRKK